MNFKKLILTVGLVAIVGSAFAQGGGQGRRGGGFMFGGGGATQLIQRDEVQTELKITEEQRTKLVEVREKANQKRQELFQSLGGAGGGGGRPDFSKLREPMEKMNAETQKEIDAILTAEQKKRLKELAIQRAGNSAVLNAETAKEVGITEEQSTKIKTLQSQQQAANAAIQEKMGNRELDFREGFEKIQSNQKAFEDELAKILTDAQKTKLKELGGKPFTFAADRRFGGGR